MADPSTPESKAEALRSLGVLNPRAESVSDEMFLREDFFDPRDLVQVKYEMLRRVHRGEASVTESAAGFGFSRPTFYRIQSCFEQDGIPGLLPHRRGPRGPHKLTPEVQEFLARVLAEDPELQSESLARRVLEHFGLTLHPRTIERSGLIPSKKNREQGR